MKERAIGSRRLTASAWLFDSGLALVAAGGTVASAATASKRRDCRHENPPPSPCSRYAVCLPRLPLPTRRDRRGGSLVAALRPVLPRRRGTAGGAWCGGRPCHRVPMGAAVHAAAGGGGRPRPA